VNPIRHVIWVRDGDRAEVRRVGVAGDFLPAMGIEPTHNRSWADEAELAAPCFDDVSLSFVNLESTLDCLDLPEEPIYGGGTNLTGPAQSLEYLQRLGAQVVGLANNHCYNFGNEGLHRTRELIRRQGLTPLGAGSTLSEPPQVYVWEADGPLRVGFWAAANNARAATAEREGVQPATTALADRALAMMKRRGATCCIALIHAGLEKTNRPDPADVKLLDAIAAQGFDVVGACHSHRISGYKRIVRGGGAPPAFCFYGLGSLSSGCIYSPLEREGLLVVPGLDRRGAMCRVEVRPVFLKGAGWGSVPDGETGERILERFAHLSAELETGAYRTRFYSDVSRGLYRRQWRDFAKAYRRGGFRGVLAKLGRMRIRHLHRVLFKLRSWS